MGENPERPPNMVLPALTFPPPPRGFPYHQGWEYALSLFALSLKIASLKDRLLAIHSHRSLKKSNSQRIAPSTLYKSMRSNPSLTKSDMSDLLVF